MKAAEVPARVPGLKGVQDKMRALGRIKSKVVKGNQKSLFDYNMDSEAEEGEEVRVCMKQHMCAQSQKRPNYVAKEAY